MKVIGVSLLICLLFTLPLFGEVGIGLKQIEEHSLFELSLRDEDIRSSVAYGKAPCPCGWLIFLPIELDLYFISLPLSLELEKLSSFKIKSGLAGEMLLVTKEYLFMKEVFYVPNVGGSLLVLFDFINFPLNNLFLKFDLLFDVTKAMRETSRFSLGIEF